MSERRAKGCLAAALVWFVILVVLGLAYRLLVHPRLQERLTGATGSASQYEHEIVLAADSFSGYAVLRSDAVRDALRAQQIKLTVTDDQADYAARIRALRDGRVQMAAFTIDSLLTASADLGEFPASIVLVLDETQGGDAMVAYEQGLRALQDLNDPDARIVLTPASPSEFLARVVIAHFNLPRLSEDWLEAADGAATVYQRLRDGPPGAKRAYVLWEPFLSRALQQPGTHVLIDSAKLRGFIVDVLVARRQFLRDYPDQVRAVVEAYCRAVYALNQGPDGFVRLVQADARQTGTAPLDPKQAEQVVQGILWKNTLENYAHFGLAKGTTPNEPTHLEDVIGNIVDVLVRTKALNADPLNGQHASLFYNRILADMQSSGFHPGGGLNLIPGLAQDDDGGEVVRSAGLAQELSVAQWDQLTSVGELKVTPIVFVRGSARISIQSERDLQELARRLQSFPRYYVRVIGHTRAEGDPEANRRLAEERAEAAADLLRSHGVQTARIRTEAAPATATQGQAQAVSFQVGQMPY